MVVDTNVNQCAAAFGQHDIVTGVANVVGVAVAVGDEIALSEHPDDRVETVNDFDFVARYREVGSRRDGERSAAKRHDTAHGELVVTRTSGGSINFHFQHITSIEGEVAYDIDAAGAGTGGEDQVFTAGGGIHVFGVGASDDTNCMAVQCGNGINGTLNGCMNRDKCGAIVYLYRTAATSGRVRLEADSRSIVGTVHQVGDEVGDAVVFVENLAVERGVVNDGAVNGRAVPVAGEGGLPGSTAAAAGKGYPRRDVIGHCVT